MNRKYFLFFLATLTVVSVTLCVFISNPTIASQTDGLLRAMEAVGFSPVAQTGQTTSYATGDDGELQAGIPWSDPRFTDNEDGTVKDELTGLIWLKNANCFGDRDWASALSDADGLASGSCGLNDGSIAGDWHLPNVRELHSLIDFSNNNPALPSGHPFTGVQSGDYWSSTTDADDSASAWTVLMLNGLVDRFTKSSPVDFYPVWPVRGGKR